MELCDVNHNKVAFDSAECPVCSVREKLEDEISDLENQIAGLEQEVERAEAELAEAGEQN